MTVPSKEAKSRLISSLKKDHCVNHFSMIRGVFNAMQINIADSTLFVYHTQFHQLCNVLYTVISESEGKEL